jgi:hypothetical protein
MTTAVAVFDPSAFTGAVQAVSDEKFALLASSSGGFLLSLKLYGASSKECKKGQIPIGHYGIRESEDDVVDLGDTVDILPLTWRPKALDWSDKNNVIAVHDMDDPEFQRIAEATLDEDTKSTCAAGPAFLVFERSTGRFLEWFCGGKSAQRAAGTLRGFLPVPGKSPPQPATLKVRFVEKQFSWHAPTVHKCSTPFTNLPNMAVINREVEKFLNPAPSEEQGEEAQSPAPRRPR